MFNKIWYVIIKSWDDFWESYEIIYDSYEYGPVLPRVEFIKPPLY